MRNSAAIVRHAVRLLAVFTVLTAGLVHLSAGASAAEITRVSYKCKATNTTIDMTLAGNDQFWVTARTELPASVQPGETVPATETDIDLIISEPFITRLYDAMEVRRLSGTSRSDVSLQVVTPGGGEPLSLTMPVNGLRSDWVDIARGTEVTIPAHGTVDAVQIPDAVTGDALIYVQLPKVFYLDSLMDPPVLGSIDKAELKCTRELDTAEARVIGTIAIGEGCTEAECPLPASNSGSGGDTGSGGDSGAGDAGPGDGSGTDPEVIDPVTPDDPTETDDPGYGWDDDDDEWDVDSNYEYASTTELPATGSSLGLGMLGLLGVLGALRVALAVRSRRAGA